MDSLYWLLIIMGVVIVGIPLLVLLSYAVLLLFMCVFIVPYWEYKRGKRQEIADQTWIDATEGIWINKYKKEDNE